MPVSARIGVPARRAQAFTLGGTTWCGCSGAAVISPLHAVVYPMTADLQALMRRHQIRLSGQGEAAIVFVHGFGTDQRMWRLVAPAFEATHRLVLFDQAGFGGTALSDWEPGHHTLQAYADDLVHIIEALSLREVTLVGHSIGGMVAVLASLARPQLARRLVLMCSSPRFLDDAPGYTGGYQPADLAAMFDLMHADYAGWARMLAPMAAGESGPQALAREFEAALRTLDARVADRFGRLAFYADLRAQLPLVRAPALVLHIEGDRVVPASVAHYLHAQLPDSRLVMLEGQGHCPPLSHPRLTIAALREHLALK